MSNFRQVRAQSVVVLGAGLSGLTAAYELEQRGCRVTVLEARSRSGGRACTLRPPLADGLHVEAGAKFVPENHDLTMGYSRTFGLRMKKLNTSKLAGDRSAIYRLRDHWIHLTRGRFVDSAGLPTTWPLSMPDEIATTQPLALMVRYVSPICADSDIFGDPTKEEWPSQSLIQAYDSLSLADLLRDRGASEEEITLMRLTYMSLAGDGIESINALWALRELFFVQQMGDAYWLVDGTDSLPSAFARRLEANIRYGAAVVRIEQKDSGVRVVYRNAGMLGSVAADYAVCTIPFSVLRNIEIDPPFSEGKRFAISELPYTSAVSVFLQSRTRFWEYRGLPRVAETDLPVTYVLDASWYQPGTRGLLMCLAAGPSARDLESLCESDRQALVLDQVDKLYPGLKEEYEGGMSYAWDSDPWALGAYSWMRPGQMGTLQPRLATPEGRIHFAGDHTSAQPGWMQGAMSSGRRAAAAIAPA
jgi:monoamine oxidase